MMKALIYFILSTSFSTIICVSQRFIGLKEVRREGKQIVNPWPTDRRCFKYHFIFFKRTATIISFVKGDIWGVSVFFNFYKNANIGIINLRPKLFTPHCDRTLLVFLMSKITKLQYSLYPTTMVHIVPILNFPIQSFFLRYDAILW